MAACDLPENLKRFRLRRKKSVSDCSAAAGCSVPSWYKYEQGLQFPASAEALDAVAAAVGSTAAKLLAAR